MSKRFRSFLLPGAALLLGASAVRAEVPADGSLQAWVTQVNSRLDAVLYEPSGTEGRVAAFVRRNDRGDLTIVRIAPANRHLVKATRTALTRLRGLPSLPAGIDPQQLIKVEILFGGDARSHERKRDAMIAAASETNRKFAGRLEQSPLALSTIR